VSQYASISTDFDTVFFFELLKTKVYTGTKEWVIPRIIGH